MPRCGVTSSASVIRLPGAIVESLGYVVVDPHRAGIGLRLPHLAEMVATRPPVGWLEIHPENFLANPHATELLVDLSRDYPILAGILISRSGHAICDPPILASITVIQLFVYPSAWTEN